MTSCNYILKNFVTIRPRHELSQEETLDWLVAVHTRAETTFRRLKAPEAAVFAETLKKTLWRVACKPDVISQRGCEISDISHRNWQDMQIYSVHENPTGASLEVRQRLYGNIVEDFFRRFYPEDALPPKHIIHVSCTGYSSPNGAQRLVSQRRWNQTVVTSAYHMGCYAAIPAIRMANGPCDIVHTELSTLHNQPLRHEPEQLVVQSLFADGFIKYSVHPENALQKSSVPYLRVLSIHEEIILDSSDAMSWNIMDTGFCMTLSPEIPRYLKSVLSGYLEVLCQKANQEISEVLATAYFAIHPGGPRILQSVQKLLELRDGQLAVTRSILRDYGNMSSATLPHIWSRMLADPSIPSGAKVVSIAFGPGLTIAGTFLEKVIPCG